MKILQRFSAILCLAGCLYLKTFSQQPAASHPDTRGKEWKSLIGVDLSQAMYAAGTWSITDGVLTATKDTAIWTKKSYLNFILDLEFKTVAGTNSGVFIHANNIETGIRDLVEVQIADDFDPEWANSPPSWQCGAIFGHQPASSHPVKQPGEWNHYTISSIGSKIRVVLNGVLVNECDLKAFTSDDKNPDGTEVPKWLYSPLADLPLRGHIGLQGKHAGKSIYFRNIKIREL